MNNDDTRYLAEKQDQLPRPQVEADEAAKERLRQNLNKSNHSKSVTVVTILFLLIVLGAGVLAYYWFQAKQELDSKQLEVAAAEDTVSQLRMQVSKLKSSQVVEQGGDFKPQSAINGVAISYVKSYRTAESLLTQPYSVKIMYMTDTFARVEVATIDKADKTKETGIEAVIFLKKVTGASNDQNWVIIDAAPSLQKIDKVALKSTFGVPDEVITGSRQE